MLQVGGVPVFADVQPDTLLIDPERVEQLITPRTKAVIGVHIGGAVCDMDALTEVCRRHGLHLIEAAAQTGRQDTAAGYLRELESLAAATSAPLLHAEAAYARPLVAGDAEAEELFRAALSRGLTGWPCFRGRMLLLYGRWLRRQRRVAESREPLRAARDSFDALGFGAIQLAVDPGGDLLGGGCRLVGVPLHDSPRSLRNALSFCLA